MAKNPFREVEKALAPKPKPKAATKAASVDLTKAQPTVRKATINAALRRQNEKKVGYSKSSTRKGKY